MNRRNFLGGLLAAPAIIRTPGLLMPVSAQPIIVGYFFHIPITYVPAARASLGDRVKIYADNDMLLHMITGNPNPLLKSVVAASFIQHKALSSFVQIKDYQREQEPT